VEQVLQLLPNFLLILCRITSFFVVVPVFSSRNVPMPFKIGLSVFISLIVFATVGTKELVPLDAMFILEIIREVLVGLVLGFIAYLFFTVVQIAGSLMDIQIGFGISNVIDPMTGASAPVLGNFKYMLAMLLFLAMNGHHLLLRAIMDSYKWIPLSNAMFAKIYDGQISAFLVETFATVFMLAFQLAAPVVAAMFLADLGLGLLTRVAPQYNIFVIGVPLKLILGLLIVIVLMPEISPLFEGVFTKMFQSIEKFFSLFME